MAAKKAAGSKALARTRQTTEETVYFVDLLFGETPRGCALVGGGMLDAALQELLLAAMGDSTVAKELLNVGNGPLKTFSARTKACKALGFISADEATDITTAREIRNDAAHKLGTPDAPLSDIFAIPDIAARCRNLRFFADRRPVANPRIAFALMAAHTAGRIDARALRLREEVTKHGQASAIAVLYAAVGEVSHRWESKGAGAELVDALFES